MTVKRWDGEAMSLLDDARRLANRTEQCPSCWYCGAWKGMEHAEECPAPSMPKIVAALEAAEHVIRLFEPARLGVSPTESDAESALLALESAMRGDA